MNAIATRVSRLLAINFGGIGDEILFLPVLESVRRRSPDLHITLLLEPRSQSIAQVTDLIDATITFDIKKRPLSARDLLDLLGLLRDGGYDLVLSSGSSKAVSVLLFLSGIPVRVGYDSGPLSRHLLTNPVRLNREQYAGGMYHDLVRGLGIFDEAPLPSIAVAPASRDVVQAMLTASGINTTGGAGASRRVLIHPGTSRLAIEKGIIKTWAVDNWIYLIEKLSVHGEITTLLAGGPDDKEIVAELEEKAAGKRFVSTAGKTRNLSDLAALISWCDLLVCVDSAPMHLGVALGKPVVALFGPTDEKKLLPRDPRFLALRGELSTCQSELTGCRKDRSGDPGVRIQPDNVYQAVMDQLCLASSQESFQESRH
jgi:ADP-heptose:LPS heptosyltransferase